jgi:hypothetical protein
MSKNQVASPANSRHSGPRRSHEEFVASTRKNRALNALEKVRNLGDEGAPGFDWTTSSNDMQRIRETSNLHRNESIAESFAAVYGEDKVFGSKKNMEHLQSITCVDLQPGDVVELRIVAITKKGVVFEQDTYKETIVSTVNLHQFPNFKKFIPKDPVKVKVMSKDANNVYVDPLQPMLDDFIASINNLVNIQANVKHPITTRVSGLQHMRAGYIGNIRIDNVSDFCGKDMYMQAFIPGSQITLNIESDFEKWDGKDVDTFVTNLAVKPGTTNVTVACSVKEYLRFLGDLNIIQMFKDYCEDNKAWKEQVKIVYDGNITGVCRTQNKTGVFVEIPSIGVTGMVPVAKEELTGYHPGPCKVRVSGFNELVRYNKDVGQMQHVEPYKIEHDVLRKVNVKCILEFVQ